MIRGTRRQQERRRNSARNTQHRARGWATSTNGGSCASREVPPQTASLRGAARKEAAPAEKAPAPGDDTATAAAAAAREGATEQHLRQLTAAVRVRSHAATTVVGAVPVTTKYKTSIKFVVAALRKIPYIIDLFYNE